MSALQQNLFEFLSSQGRQLAIVTKTTRPVRFAGASYEPKADKNRLTGQLLRIFRLMRDQEWRTLREIAELTGDPEASISAQLRNLKKPAFGSHGLEKRIRGERTRGLFEYKLIVSRKEFSE